MKTFAQQLIEVINAADYTARSYSGRCMYGKYCVGLTTNDSGFTVAMKLIREASSILEEPESFIDELSDVRALQDSVGLSSIIYFPSVKWTDDEEDEDEDESCKDCGEITV